MHDATNTDTLVRKCASS